MFVFWNQGAFPWKCWDSDCLRLALILHETERRKAQEVVKELSDYYEKFDLPVQLLFKRLKEDCLHKNDQ